MQQNEFSVNVWSFLYCVLSLDNSTLWYTSPHATTSGCGCLEGRFERPPIQVWGYGFEKLRGKVKDCEFVKEAVDPYSIKGLSHIQEDCACQSPLVKVSGYSFYKAGEL